MSQVNEAMVGLKKSEAGMAAKKQKHSKEEFEEEWNGISAVV